MIKNLLDVFRPLRWYRNTSMVFGVLFAYKILGLTLAQITAGPMLSNIVVAFVALCLIASGNYGVNEVLDSASDKFHPKKKFRAIPSGKISAKFVIFLSILLYIGGLVIAFSLGNYMLFISIALLAVSGFFYNVKPFRFKDKPYFDFTFEALNNPIRLMVGWYAVATPAHIVPVSLILGFWFMGIFLMASKRFGEFRFIKNPKLAAGYRNSLKYYSEENLLISMISASVAFSFMFGALCMKYSVDLILILPVFIVWIAWFFKLANMENTIVKDPERIFENKPFLFFSILMFATFFYLFFSGNQFIGWVK